MNALTSHSLKSPKRIPPSIRYAGLTFSEDEPGKPMYLEAFICDFFDNKSRLLGFKAMEVSYEKAAAWLTPIQPTDEEVEQGAKREPKIKTLFMPKTLQQGDFSAFAAIVEGKQRCAISESDHDFYSLVAGGTLTADSKAPQSLPLASKLLLAGAHRVLRHVSNRTTNKPTSRSNARNHPGVRGYSMMR